MGCRRRVSQKNTACGVCVVSPTHIGKTFENRELTSEQEIYGRNAVRLGWEDLKSCSDTRKLLVKEGGHIEEE